MSTVSDRSTGCWNCLPLARLPWTRRKVDALTQANDGLREMLRGYQSIAPLELPEGAAQELAAVRKSIRDLQVFIVKAKPPAEHPWMRPLPEEQKEWSEIYADGGTLLRRQVCVAASGSHAEDWVVGRLFISDAGIAFEGDAVSPDEDTLNTGLLLWGDITGVESCRPSVNNATLESRAPCQLKLSLCEGAGCGLSFTALRLQLSISRHAEFLEQFWRQLALHSKSCEELEETDARLPNGPPDDLIPSETKVRVPLHLALPVTMKPSARRYGCASRPVAIKMDGSTHGSNAFKVNFGADGSPGGGRRLSLIREERSPWGTDGDEGAGVGAANGGEGAGNSPEVTPAALSVPSSTAGDGTDSSGGGAASATLPAGALLRMPSAASRPSSRVGGDLTPTLCRSMSSPGTSKNQSTRMSFAFIPKKGVVPSAQTPTEEPLFTGNLAGMSLNEVRLKLHSKDWPMAQFLKEALGAYDLTETRWCTSESVPGTAARRARFIMPLPKDVPGAVAMLVSLPETSHVTIVYRLRDSESEVVLLQQTCTHDVTFGENFRVQETLSFTPSRAGGVDVRKWVEVIWAVSLPWSMGAVKSFIERKSNSAAKASASHLVRVLEQTNCSG